jgi:Lrp/AsnC family transcriptional regulator
MPKTRECEMSLNIDKIDRAILLALQKNGSLSQQALAEEVGASAASCWRRIKAMEAVGLLKLPVRLVDATKIGLSVTVLCNVRVSSHQSNARADFETFVRDAPEILACFSISGDWDYLIRIVARDVADYERFLMRTLLEHPSVATASSHFALSTIKEETALPV